MSELPAPQRRALEVALLRAEPEGAGRCSAPSASGCSGCCAASRSSPSCSRSMTSTGSTTVGERARLRRAPPARRCGSACRARRGGGHQVPLGPRSRARKGASSAWRCTGLDDGRARPAPRAPGSGRRSRGAPSRACPRVRRQPLLRARDRAGAGRAGRAARPVGRAADPGEPAGARARPARASAGRRARRRRRSPRRSRARRRPCRRGSRRSGGSSAAAIEAGVLERDGERLTSPTRCSPRSPTSCSPRRSAASCTPALAELVDDPEERARHLALAADGPTRTVAAALVAARPRRAAARGAPDAAAELLEQARRLTPADGAERGGGADRGRRAAPRGGRRGARATLLEEVLAEAPPGGERAYALARLGWVRAHHEGFRAAADVFFAALAEPTDDVALRIEIDQGLAGACTRDAASRRRRSTRAPRSRWPRSSATRRCSPVRSRTSRSSSRSAATGMAMATIERALALEHRPRVDADPRPARTGSARCCSSGTGGLDAGARPARRVARARRSSAATSTRCRSCSSSSPAPSCCSATGTAARAPRARVRGVGRRRAGRSASGRTRWRSRRSWPPTRRGRAARARIARGHRARRARGVRPGGARAARDARVPRALARARPRRRAALRRVARALEASGLREPALFRFQADAIEAKVALGKRDEAGGWSRSSSAAARLERHVAAGDGRPQPRAAALGAGDSERRPRAGEALALGAGSAAVRARAHAARARGAPAPRSQEARRARVARGGARRLRRRSAQRSGPSGRGRAGPGRRARGGRPS